MKKTFLFINFLIAILLANAQSPAFEWAKSAGGLSEEFGMATITDKYGNVYITGYFYNTVDFDPGPGVFNLTETGNYAMYILKLNPAGNFVWAKGMGGTAPNSGVVGYDIKLDSAGNIYAGGGFDQTDDFDPGPGTFNMTAVSSTDIFILKLDSSGNFVWAKQMGGASVDVCVSLALDGSNNIYSTGTFQGTTDFDPGAGIFNLTSASATYYDVYVSKLDASGNFVWAKRMGGSRIDQPRTISLDLSGNIYTTGHFNDTADFDPGAGVYNLNGYTYDVFISKLSNSGNFLWAKKIGGELYPDYGASTVDESGNSYIVGTFYDTVDFDPGAAVHNLVAYGGNTDVFILKLNTSGNFVWAKNIGGTGPENAGRPVIDIDKNIYLTGKFKGTPDFDPGAGVYNLTSSASGEDLYCLKLNPSGNFVWVKSIAGPSPNIIWSAQLTIDKTGNIFTIGDFEGTIDFDPGAGISNLTAVGGGDIYIYKMSQCITPSANITPGGATTFCSGGNVVLNANTGAGLTYQWKKNNVTISGATNSGYSAATAGSYTVVVTNSCGPATSSAVSVTVNSLPSATITPAGATTFCSGGSVILNVPSGNNKSYQWKKGSNIISGATLPSYTATTGGNYRVTVTNTATGCSKTTGSATVVTVNALPSATIAPQGPTTFCAGGSVLLKANTGTGLTYKWKKGGNNISGATTSNYTATLGGTYKVEVTKSNGCSMTSAGVVVTVPCKEGEISSHISNLDFTVYPNPNPGVFTISFSNATAPIEVEITDPVGQIVKKFVTNENSLLINEPNLAQGIYCLVVKNKEGMLMKKISIAK